ncbi:hypothetical protein LDENG_00130580 [Lucifuga dentata]|nr:hypothetical protein LDENG_00130580 [Lucifuga dentata]
MSGLETFLQDTLRSEQMFQQQIQELRESLRQQLWETERTQKEELDRRIQQDALLSAFTKQESSEQKQLDCHAKHVVQRRSNSPTALTLDKGNSCQLRQSERSISSSPAWVYSTNRLCCSVRMSRMMQLENEAAAECQKKFCAPSVPGHVSLLLYKEIMELREKARKKSHEQRKNFLLSMQKPFSFQERENEKSEKLLAMLNQVSQDQKTKHATGGKSCQKAVKDSSGSEQKDQDLCRKVHTQETLKKNTTQLENRTGSGSPKLRTAELTKKEMLGFLDEKPSFHPKIIHEVPDFSRLHKALQTMALRNAERSTERRDGTKCWPFHLRTSALPTRQHRMSPEPSQVPKVSHHFRSLGDLTSLSSDTLPTYITDAARKRCMAIRKSMELRESKKEESADWMRKHQIRSQAMKETISIHAKLLDPLCNLKEVYNEKLQHHREADQQRMREYMRELKDIKARVGERPYLFEQVKQKTAKAHAEQMYRNKLRKAGLSEHFVETKGEAAEASSSSSCRSDDDDTDDTDVNDHTENDIQSKYAEEENVDDGEKIEDVEEKSVKSKEEEMP